MSQQTNHDFRQTIRELLVKGRRNHFSALHKEDVKISLNVTLFLFLLIAFCPAALVILLIGLFCGCKYRFSGPDFPEDNALNRMFNQLARLYERAEDDKDDTDEDA